VPAKSEEGQKKKYTRPIAIGNQGAIDTRPQTASAKKSGTIRHKKKKNKKKREIPSEPMKKLQKLK